MLLDELQEQLKSRTSKETRMKAKQQLNPSIQQEILEKTTLEMPIEQSKQLKQPKSTSIVNIPDLSCFASQVASLSNNKEECLE